MFGEPVGRTPHKHRRWAPNSLRTCLNTGTFARTDLENSQEAKHQFSQPQRLAERLALSPTSSEAL